MRSLLLAAVAGCVHAAAPAPVPEPVPVAAPVAEAQAPTGDLDFTVCAGWVAFGHGGFAGAGPIGGTTRFQTRGSEATLTFDQVRLPEETDRTTWVFAGSWDGTTFVPDPARTTEGACADPTLCGPWGMLLPQDGKPPTLRSDPNGRGGLFVPFVPAAPGACEAELAGFDAMRLE